MNKEALGNVFAGLLVGLLMGLISAWFVFNGHGHARDLWRTGHECATMNGAPCTLEWRWEK